jgi:hypothetical protein
MDSYSDYEAFLLERKKIEEQGLCNLFEVIKDFIWLASGDGEGYIISSRYKEIANLFEKYEEENNIIEQYKKNMYDNSIVFSSITNPEETIIFTKDRDGLPNYKGKVMTGDITVEIP